MKNRSFVLTVLLLPVLLLAGCVPVAPKPRTPTSYAWKEYLHESPFSYSTDNSSKVIAMLSRKIGAINLDGVDGGVGRHIEEARKWTADYPVYVERAMIAADRAYREGRRLRKPMETGGKYLGRELADENNDSKFKRMFGGYVGEWLGGYVNEAYSQSLAREAASRVLAPFVARGRQLAADEYAINQRLNYPSTEHLRDIVAASR